MRLLWKHFDDNKLCQSLQFAIQKNPGIQRDVFDLLCASDDPEFLEECKWLLAGIIDTHLLQEVLERFKVETHPSRKFALGYILGASWGKSEVQRSVLELLEGDDVPLQESVLQLLSLSAVEKADDETRTRATRRLRVLAQGGATDELRRSATRAMRGALDPEDIRLLIELMLKDRSPGVRSAAMGSLPSNYRYPSPLMDEQARAFHIVALDETRPAGFRRRCAHLVLQISESGNTETGVYAISETEKARLSRLISELK